MQKTDIKLAEMDAAIDRTSVDVVIGDEAEPPSPHLSPYELTIVHWPIRDLDEDQLEALSKDKDLFLNLTEMKTIQDYFRRLEREPTDAELETLAQTWSEHCGHKTLRSAVDMTIDGQKLHYRIPYELEWLILYLTNSY